MHAKSNIKKLLIPLLVLAVAALIFVLLIKTKPEAKPVAITEKAWPVSVQLAEPQRIAPEITLYGRVEAQWDSRLTAVIAADVVDVPVREGAEVAAGELLVRLDDAEVQLRLSQAEADLRQADARIGSEQARHQANVQALPRERNLLALVRKELDRAEDLLKKKLASQSSLDTARQALDRQAIALSARQQSILEHEARMAELQAARARAKASLDQAQLDLARTHIRAPFAGRIAKLLVSPGQRVRVGDGLVNIYDTSNLLVRAQIPDGQLSQVHDALAAGTVLTASGNLDGRPVTARLQRLAGEIGQGGGVAALFLLAANDDGLRPGRFLRLNLQLPPRADLLVLPAQALFGLDRVYLVDQDSRLRGHAVQRVGDLRLPDGTSQVLLSADTLPAASRILTTQLPNAMEGLRVSVISN